MELSNSDIIQLIGIMVAIITGIACKSNSNKAEVPIEVFNVEITYKTLNETVKSTFHINYNFLNGYTETNSPSKTTESALDKINQSIQGLQQK